jgi:hypothetical protein
MTKENRTSPGSATAGTEKLVAPDEANHHQKGTLSESLGSTGSSEKQEGHPFPGQKMLWKTLVFSGFSDTSSISAHFLFPLFPVFLIS